MYIIKNAFTSIFRNKIRNFLLGCIIFVIALSSCIALSIREAAKNNIFIAAHATPNLFGDPTQTTGFNDQEYESALKLYKMMVINPSIEIFDRSINYIFENKH